MWLLGRVDKTIGPVNFEFEELQIIFFRFILKDHKIQTVLSKNLQDQEEHSIFYCATFQNVDNQHPCW